MKNQAEAASSPRGIVPWLIATALVAATLLAYLPALRGTPVWDDDQHLTRADLRGWSGLRRIWFEVGATQQYYPVTHTAFWIGQRLWGAAPMGYHLVNVLLHAASALILWGLLRRLGVGWAPLAAGLFALHPLNVESVAWISELKNTLSAALGLGATYAFVRFRERRRAAWYVGALSLFVLALGAKTTVVMLPVALVLTTWWLEGWRGARRDAVWLAPMFAVGLAAGLSTAWVERRWIGAEGDAYAATFADRCLIAARALWFYAAKFAWPASLLFVYPRWSVGRGTWWPYPLAALALFGALLIGGRRTRGPLAAALAFAALLFPALGFFNVYPFVYSFVANHFAYLGGLAIFALAAGATARLVNGRPAALRNATALGWGLVLLALGALTFRDAHAYANAETLWDETIDRNPQAWMAFYNRGVLRAADGRPEAARADFERTLRLNPTHFKACNNLAAIANQAGDYSTGLAYATRAIELNPDLAESYYNRGNARFGLRDVLAAVVDYTRALNIGPPRAAVHNNRGNAYAALGQYPQAVADYDAALRIDPAYAEAYHNRAAAHLALRQFDAAWADVHACSAHGGLIRPELLRRLREASGREE